MAVWVLHDSLFKRFLSIMISWRHISQGRVATHLRCGGIFNYHFIANLSQSLTMEEFENRLRHKFTATFLYVRQCICNWRSHSRGHEAKSDSTTSQLSRFTVRLILNGKLSPLHGTSQSQPAIIHPWQLSFVFWHWHWCRGIEIACMYEW